MAKLNKGQILLKCMTHALFVGLEQIPGVGAIVDLVTGWHKIIEEEQNKLSLEERVVQLEEAARTKPIAARQLALEFLQEKQLQGEIISEEKIAAICDLLAFTPATIKEHTESTLRQARRYNTNITTVLPITATHSELERENFYRSLLPARRPRFQTGDELIGGSPGWVLGEFLGAGGFGEVWEAKKLGLCRAVKFCLDERSAKILRREAQALSILSELDHPNVVRLLDLNLDVQPYWLAFDFIAGGSLEALLRAKSLSLQESLDLFKEIITGIAAVHKKGIIHRDLKPSNILLTVDNKPKISDFGIGKVVADNAVRTMPTTQYTTLGYGTHGYMSPEQQNCLPADPSDDTYALGVMLWQMLTHKLQGPTIPEMFAINNLDIPDVCKTVITECLTKPRGQRPQDGSALLALLDKSVIIKPPGLVLLKDRSPAPEMVIIPAGDFMMGSNDYDSEKPIHKVTIAQPFAISKYQVTFEEYDKYCDATGSKKHDDEGWGRGKRPVINVSWDDAQKYCQWLSDQTGQHYRLPTEPEWEYACRAGSTTKWCFGNDENQLKDYAWYYANSGKKTHPVGEKKPNKFGLYDMHGNVWEWCEDSWHENYNGAPTDGSAWKNSNENRSLLRGGSWNYDANSCRSANRDGDNRDNRYGSYGVRLVCSVRA